MLTTLPNDEVFEALLDVRAGLASTLLTAGLDRCLTEVSNREQTLRASDPETEEVRHFLTIYAEYMTKDARCLAENTAIFCHHLPVCNAVARRTKEHEPFVVIYSGLLAVATYRLCIAVLFTNIQLMIKRWAGDQETALTHLTTLAVNAQVLSYWFYIEGGDLPDLFDIFCDQHRSQVRDGLAGALVFIVLHEIGHIVLGHTKPQKGSPPQLCSMVSPEDLTRWKAMELEADHFAISGIDERLKQTMAANMLIVLDLMADLECLCLPQSMTHPLVINRIHSLSAAMRLDDDAFFAERIGKIIAQKKAILSVKIDAGVSSALGITASEPVSWAVDLFRRSLPSRATCVRAVETLKSMYDRIDYIGPSLG